MEREGSVRIPAGCAIAALISKEGRMIPGDVIIRGIATMHDRSNGLGGGFAAYGIYPEHRDQYALHIFFDSKDRRSVCEGILRESFEVVRAERIPTRKIPAITDEPMNEDKSPTMIIGGTCGSFLGEYQAGGTIIVLGLTAQERPIVSNFPCTGMHGGTMFLRGSCDAIRFPQNVDVSHADAEDIAAIDERLTEFCTIFSYDKNVVMEEGFTKIVPSSSNPYKALYVTN